MSIGSTYWITQAGYLYVSLVTDAYSRRIMGYEVAQSLEAVHSCHALQMALQAITKQIGKDLIHHSDRGLQYCSNEYTTLLDSFDIQISMTENSDPLENAGPDADIVVSRRQTPYCKGVR